MYVNNRKLILFTLRKKFLLTSGNQASYVFRLTCEDFAVIKRETELSLVNSDFGDDEQATPTLNLHCQRNSYVTLLTKVP